MRKLALILAVTVAFAADGPLLEPGRRLVAQLQFDPTADAVLFRAAGLENSQKLLSAVLSQGQDRNATTDDWTNLHRAADGLVELFLLQDQTFKASIFAGLQSMFYRNLEHDYTRALAASQRAVDLQEKAGEKTTLDIAIQAVGANLLSLGRLDEALDAY